MTDRPWRALRPHLRALAVATSVAALGVLTTSCGSDDASGPEDASVVLDEPADGAAPAVGDEQQLRDLVDAYDAAVNGLVVEGRTSAFEGVATSSGADRFVEEYRTNLVGNGLQMLGEWRYEFLGAAVEGDTADVRMCVDGTDLYVVEEGALVGEGDRNQGRRRAVLEAVREDGRWLVEDVRSGGAPC